MKTTLYILLMFAVVAAAFFIVRSLARYVEETRRQPLPLKSPAAVAPCP